MAEIKTPLARLGAGETFTAGEDGAWVITEANTHADILRFVVADIGTDASVVLAGVLSDLNLASD